MHSFDVLMLQKSVPALYAWKFAPMLPSGLEMMQQKSYWKNKDISLS